MFYLFTKTAADFSAKDIQDAEECQMEQIYDSKDLADYILEKDYPFGEIFPELRVVYTLKGDDERKYIV